MTPATYENILGYQVLAINQYACIGDIMSWIGVGDYCRWLACINPHSYVVAKHDPSFKQALKSADWLIPDGSGIVLASRMLGGVIRERITGSDVFKGVHDRLKHTGGRVFFLGATEDTLSAIRTKMRIEYPNICVAGLYSPPFKPVFSEEDTNAMVAAINSSAPDVLWVGMTSPKQDLWIHANQHRLNVRFAAGVGAVFDFYVGRVKRSHPFFQRLGLEWLPRLLREPRRLWRRMCISAPIFLWDVMREVATQYTTRL